MLLFLCVAADFVATTKPLTMRLPAAFRLSCFSQLSCRCGALKAEPLIDILVWQHHVDEQLAAAAS